MGTLKDFFLNISITSLIRHCPCWTFDATVYHTESNERKVPKKIGRKKFWVGGWCLPFVLHHILGEYAIEKHNRDHHHVEAKRFRPSHAPSLPLHCNGDLSSTAQKGKHTHTLHSAKVPQGNTQGNTQQATHTHTHSTQC